MLVLYGAVSWSRSPSPAFSGAEWMRLACGVGLYFVVTTAMRRREQVHGHRHASAEQARRLPHAEHFLNAHGKHWHGGIGVIDLDARAGRHLDVRWREVVERTSLFPVEQGAERLDEVESFEITQPTAAGEQRSEPNVE